MTIGDWIALLQATAYVTLAIVAIVTLRRASVTLLQPLRTEAFRVQLEELRGLLQLISHRDELELREIVGFGELTTANAVRLHDLFFRDVYGVTVDESDRPYSSEECPETIVHDDYLVADHQGSSHPFRGQHVAIVRPKPGPHHDARAWWSNFELGDLKIPTKQAEFIHQLRRASTSPLLPLTVAQKINDLLSIINKNIELLFDVLSEAGRELPEVFTSANPPETFEIRDITNSYYQRFTALTPRVVALTNAIRDHLAIDQLTKPWTS